VIENPKGREIGSIQVRLTAQGRADPLFTGFAERALFQATHEDVLATAPQGAVLLAENQSTPFQALAFGGRCRSVQFHPELSPAGMRAVIESRQELLEREAERRGVSPKEHVRSLLFGIAHTPLGSQLLRNFFTYFT
jgi:GMP synthase (glutamine-hydrolysing)